MQAEQSPNFGRKTLSEQVADSIAEQIRRGEWQGLAPSSREIAIMHKVSLPTAQEALAHLVFRKLLRERGPKRRLEVMPAEHPEVAAAPREAVLVLSARSLGLLDISTLLAVRQLESRLLALGHRYRLVDLGHLAGSALRKAAYAEVVDFQATHCLMTSADSELYAGLARHPVAIAALAGKLNAARMVRLARPFSDRLDFTLQRLAALGHQRVLLLRRSGSEWPDLGDAPSPKFGQRFGVSLQQQTYAQLADFSQALQVGLTHGVTAVLFMNMEAVIQGLVYCADKRIQLPDGLSLVNLQGELDTLQGSPAVVGVALRPEAKTFSILRWVGVECAPEENSYYWKEGDTLGSRLGVAAGV
jgi:hypothetical protein